ncbi:WXG100 family type VII secretion target [Streptomyces sp. NPDC052396]|uniref:WXG100 family type VII secretion target n=1 Tax=Streptomyces sp. NPDC052396 TaxID=3365689 RepID=UPI0037D37DA9
MSPMPAGPGYRIEADEVGKAAGAARKVAKEMPEEIKSLFGPSDSAVSGVRGWQTGKEVHECLEAWTQALRSLAGMVEKASEKVAGSAGNYKATDQHNGESLRSGVDLPKSWR